MDASFQFGSESGATVAFFLFLLITLFIACATYILLTRAGVRRAQFRHWPVVARPLAAVFALLLFGLTFGLVYFHMVHGFYHLEAGREALRLQYFLPRHTVQLPLTDVGEITREAGLRGEWRLVVYTRHGAKYRSAQARYQAVKQAWERLRSMPRPPP